MPHTVGAQSQRGDGWTYRLAKYRERLGRHASNNWRRCCCLSVCCVVFLLALVTVIVDLVFLSHVFTINVHYGIAPINADGTQAYALSINDSRNHSSDSELCRDLVVKSMSSSAPYNIRDNATLYILNGIPPLSRVEAFYINGDKIELTSVGDYRHWDFYLNRGSNVSLEVCNIYQYSGTGGIVLYVIRGSGNFSRWQNDSTNENYTMVTYILSSNCETHMYTVLTEGALYYFVLYERQRYSDKYQLSTTFYVQSTVFSVSPSAIIHSCSILLDGSSSCSVDVPLFSSYSALLSVNTTIPIDRTTEADFYISCHSVTRRYPYAQVAVLIAFPVVAVMIFVIVCASILIYCNLVMKRRRDYSPLPGINARVTPVASRNTLEESTKFAPILRENVNPSLPRNNARARPAAVRNEVEDSTSRGSGPIRENVNSQLPEIDARATTAASKNELEDSTSVSAPIRENVNSVYLK